AHADGGDGGDDAVAETDAVEDLEVQSTAARRSGRRAPAAACEGATLPRAARAAERGGIDVAVGRVGEIVLLVLVRDVVHVEDADELRAGRLHRRLDVRRQRRRAGDV